VLNNRVIELEAKLKKIEHLYVDSKINKSDPFYSTFKKNQNHSNSTSQKDIHNVIKNKDLTTKFSLSFSDKFKISNNNTPKKQLVNVELYKPLIPHAKYRNVNKPPLQNVKPSKVNNIRINKHSKENFPESEGNKIETIDSTNNNKDLTFVEKLDQIKYRTRNLLELYNKQSRSSIKK
jgi:hypothetical protein